MTRSHERLSEERRHGVFSKRPQLSVSRQSLGLSLGHRRLRFSFQINDFKDPEPENRSYRLAPGCGGGGDVVASLSRVKRYFRRRTSFQRPRPEAREALFSASFSCVKWFFLKKNLCLQTTLEGRRRRLSKEAASPCQPGFFSHFADRRPKPSGRKKPPGKPERLASVSSDDSIGARNLTETP